MCDAASEGTTDTNHRERLPAGWGTGPGDPIVGIVPRVSWRCAIDDTDEILLVEDSPSDVELTIRALRKAGIANPVRTAIDGAEALEMLSGHETVAGNAPATRPVLLILDLKMPRIGGLELLDALKANEETRMIPVIVLTSSREVADIREAYRRGANSYIVKPVESEQFGAAISQLAHYWIGLNERSY